MIHTVANGELLEKVFFSLSQILYGGEEGVQGTFRLLVRLALTFGAFAALCLAFFRQKFEPLIRGFFLPGLAILALLLTPRTGIEIQDHGEKASKRKVENVPWFLSTLAGWSSELFYRVETLFAESIKTRYLWTREFQSGSSPFSFQRLPLETPLRGFCRECVSRDLRLGVYSQEELFGAADLFDFFKKRSSSNRTISCKEAIEKIDASLTGDLLVDALVEGDLSSRDVSLCRLMKGEEKQWIKQQIAIKVLQEELFDANRESGKSWFQITASSIISLRNFSEALLYLIFPLVLLLSLLSFGLKLILEWIRFLVWISLWPILYVAVDLFLQTLWESRLPSLGLTLGTYEEISSLYHSMEILAAFLIASIPVFTWAFLQTGISGITHHFSQSSSHEIKAPDQNKKMPEEAKRNEPKHILKESKPAKQSAAHFFTRESSKTVLTQETRVAKQPQSTLPQMFSPRTKQAPPQLLPEKETMKMHTPLKEEPKCSS